MSDTYKNNLVCMAMMTLKPVHVIYFEFESHNVKKGSDVCQCVLNRGNFNEARLSFSLYPDL